MSADDRISRARAPRIDIVPITPQMRVSLKTAWERSGLTKTKLGERVGRDQTFVTKVVNGPQASLSRIELEAWARAGRVTPEWLEFGQPNDSRDASVPSTTLSPDQHSAAVFELLRKSASAVVGGGIRELTAADFEARGDLTLDVRRFLQGGAPSPRVAVHGAVPRQAAADLWEACSASDLLLLHGPIGEGTSTTLLQAAHHAVGAGRRVLQVANPEALNSLPHHPAWNDRPFVIFDDAHRLSRLPPWLLNAFPGDPMPTFILGAQTRRRAQVTKLFQDASRPIKEWRLPRIKVGASTPYIRLIVDFQAAPEEIGPQEIARLFKEGLERPGSLSGLWPAQFQATRGALLDDRLGNLLSGHAPTARIISIIAFYGGLSLFSNGHFPSADRILLEGTLKGLNLEPLAESECLVSLRGIFGLLEGELQHDFGYQDIEQQRNYEIELRHPALAECLFRHAFGSMKEVNQPLFDKWQYYVAAIKAIGAGRSNSAPKLTYEVLRQMQKATYYDVRKGGALRNRLISTAYPQIGDRVLDAIAQAEAAVGVLLTDGGWYSRRLNTMKAILLIHAQRTVSEGDKARARERLDAALANAVKESDHEVLRFAARIAQSLNYTTAEGDWRSLIEAAERLEPNRSDRPKMSTRTHIELALKARRIEGLLQLQKVFERARLRHPDWDDNRLEVLHRLLNWVRREGDEQICYHLPKVARGEGLNSIRAIYQELWREMWRREKEDFRFLLNTRNSLINGRLKSTFKMWTADFANVDDAWPVGVMEAVAKASQARNAWREFIRSYPTFFTER